MTHSLLTIRKALTGARRSLVCPLEQRSKKRPITELRMCISNSLNALRCKILIISPIMLLLGACATAPERNSWQDIGSFGDFSPPKTPAHALICPQNYCLGPPDRLTPLMTMTADRLRNVVRDALDREPDTILLARTDEGLRLVYRQSNGWGVTSSTITVGIVDADETTSSVALYGQFDGTGGSHERELRRLERWYADIARAVAVAVASVR